MVLAAMCFSQHLARRGREEGEVEKRRPFQARNDGRFIKRSRALLRGRPLRAPPTPCVWPIVTGLWHQLPPTPLLPSPALCHCKSPRRLKQSHSHPFSTVTTLFWCRLLAGGERRLTKKKDCLAVTKHTGDTEMGVTLRGGRDSRKEG